MVNQELRKLTIASILTAMSIILDIVFKMFIPANLHFGFPYYAIPLVIGSLILGPIYGGSMGLISDYLGFILFPGPYAYDVLFALRAVMWGVIPSFIATYKSNWPKLLLAIFLGHVFATTSSTLANFISQYVITNDYSQSWIYAYTQLTLRIYMLPVNVVIMTVVINVLNKVLSMFYDNYLKKPTIK